MCSEITNSINFKVNSALKDISTKEGIGDYVMEFAPGSSEMDGCTATLISVKIIGKQPRKTLNLIVKQISTSEAYRKKFPIKEMFNVELHMYTNVLPTYEILQLEHGLSPLRIYPRFYKAIEECNYETVIMENVKSSGFQLCKEIILNNDHLELAISECGRLHALSFALKSKQPIKFQEITPRNHLGVELYEKYLRKSASNLCEKSLSILDPVSDMEAIAKFRPYVENLNMFFKSLKEYSDDKYFIIVHGDFWSNNLMFKYEDVDKPTKPTQVCIFDFQTSALGSPAMDLALLIYTNFASGNYDHVDQYLKLYYKNLSNHLEKFNCDCSTLYPFEVLKRQWKIYAKFGFLIAQFVAYVLSCEGKCILDFESVAESDTDFESVLSGNTSCNDVNYKSIVKPLILHLIKNNFL